MTYTSMAIAVAFGIVMGLIHTRMLKEHQERTGGYSMGLYPDLLFVAICFLSGYVIRDFF